jgi:hypothetical protein
VNRRRDVVVAGYVGDVPKATEALDDPSPDVRAAALGALARVEALTATHLRQALTDSDRSVVRRAIELSIDVPEVELLPLVERRDSTIVEVAAWALGERGAGQPVEVVERLSQIVQGKGLGFTLSEIGLLIDQWEAGNLSNQDKARVIEQKIDEIVEKMERLGAIKAHLVDKLQQLNLES